MKRERDRKALNTFNIDFANGDPDNLRDLFFPNHLLPFPLIYRSHRSGTPRTHCLQKSFVSVLLRLQSSEDKVGLLQGLRVGFTGNIAILSNSIAASSGKDLLPFPVQIDEINFRGHVLWRRHGTPKPFQRPRYYQIYQRLPHRCHGKASYLGVVTLPLLAVLLLGKLPTDCELSGVNCYTEMHIDFCPFAGVNQPTISPVTKTLRPGRGRKVFSHRGEFRKRQWISKNVSALFSPHVCRCSQTQHSVPTVDRYGHHCCTHAH